MEVDKPDDSNTGDTPEAVVDPAVPAIPEAVAEAAQEEEVPALSPTEMEVDKPEDSEAGDAPEAVVDPAVPVIPEEVAEPSRQAEVPASSEPRDSGARKEVQMTLDFRTCMRSPRGSPPPEPVPHISRKNSDYRRQFDVVGSSQPGPSGLSTAPSKESSDKPGSTPFVFMDCMANVFRDLKNQKPELSKPPPPKPDLFLKKFFQNIFDFDHSVIKVPDDELFMPRIEVEDILSQYHPIRPVVEFHPIMNPTYPKVQDSSRPTTPTVEDSSPFSDSKFLEKIDEQEPPTEILAEESVEGVSAMETSKPSSPASTGTSKRSPPSLDDVSKDTSYATGTSKRSPPVSIDDVSKDTTYTIDTLKPSPPASTDTSKISPPTSVDVSKDKTTMQDEDAQLEPPTGTLQDEDAQLEPPTGKSVEACLKEFTAVDIPKLSPLSSVDEDSKSTSSTLAVLGIEGPSGFLSRLSPMVQSPQRSPQRVPGVSRLSSAATSRDTSRQSTSSSVALGTSRKRLLERDEDDEPPTVYRAVDESDETVEFETRQTLATVLSELDDASRQSYAAALDTSKPSSQASMDDASKATSSSFEEGIYLPHDAFAVTEEDSGSRQSAKDEVKAPTLYETLLANEARAGSLPGVSAAAQPSQPSRPVAQREVSRRPEAMEVGEAAQPGAPEILVDEAAQPGAPEVLVDVVPQPVPAEVPVDSSQPGPSGVSTSRRRPVFESSDESSLSNESSSDSTRAFFRRKSLKVFGTRMYLSSLPKEEVEEVNQLTTMTSTTLKILADGNAPFRFLVDHFGDIISNQYIMFELVKASQKDKPALHGELENQCKMNYMTMLKIQRLIKSYTDEKGLNRYLLSVLKYIQATVHELDVFNHALYRYRGFTSLHNRTMAERTWSHFVRLKEKNVSNRIIKKKNVGVTCEYFNNLEKWRLESSFYEDFYNAYKALRGLMQNLRMRYMPEGVIFSMDDLPGLRHARDPFTMELAVVLPTDVLIAFLSQDLENQRVVMDRAAMIEYVQMYVARIFHTEDNFNKLYRQLVDRDPSGDGDDDDDEEEEEEENNNDNNEDNVEIQELKEVLFKDYKRFVDEVKKIGPFNFLIEGMLDILAKTLDVILCLNKFTEKRDETLRNLEQMVRGGPEQIEHERLFNEYVTELKCVVACLQELVYKKIMTMQAKLRNIKNECYGTAYNSFVDIIRLKLHELDRINTDRSNYESPEYIAYTGRTSDDLWAEKVNDVYQTVRTRFRYIGNPPLKELPDAEMKFVQKQAKLFGDNTYRAAVRLLLALCTAVGNLQADFRIKIREIMSHDSRLIVDDDAAANLADAAVNMADVAVEGDAAVNIAAVAVDEANAAVGRADAAVEEAVAVDRPDAAVAEAAAVAVDRPDAAVEEAAAVAVDRADAPVVAVDATGATAGVVDAANIPGPAVGKVDCAVMTDAPEATVAASSAAD